MSNLLTSNGGQWFGDGSTFQLAGPITPRLPLPLGIYTAHQSLSGWFLQKEANQYDFPYKVYNYENEFINRIRNTYYNTTKNLGVLLNGFKGAGKSVTAKLICNELKLPIIIIPKYISGLEQYIASIPDDVIIFIDEYEKVFNKDLQQIMLSLMDGANDVHGRKLFLLTTNQLSINENMISRPGRIRYIKSYSDLDPKIINAIVDDSLLYPELKGDVMNFISRLKMISIDLVKSIISEVNLYKESPNAFAGIFNAELTPLQYKLSLFTFTPKGAVNELKTIEYQCKAYYSSVADLYHGRSMYIDNKYVGDYLGYILDDEENISVLEVRLDNTSALRAYKSYIKTISWTLEKGETIDPLSFVNDEMIKLYIDYHGSLDEHDDNGKLIKSSKDVVLDMIKNEEIVLLAINREFTEGYHKSFRPNGTETDYDSESIGEGLTLASIKFDDDDDDDIEEELKVMNEASN